MDIILGKVSALMGITFVHIQCKRSYCHSHHMLLMVEKDDRIRVKRKFSLCTPSPTPESNSILQKGREKLMVQKEGKWHLIKEQVDGARIQSKRECFQESDVVAHQLLVRKIKAMINHFIDVIVRQNVVWSQMFAVQKKGAHTYCFLVLQILDENSQGLENLNLHSLWCLLLKNSQEIHQYVLLQEETVKIAKPQDNRKLLTPPSPSHSGLPRWSIRQAHEWSLSVTLCWTRILSRF